MQGAMFYIMLLPNLIFLPVIPFLCGVLLSVPAMYVVGYLKNKFVVMLVLYIICVAAGFTVYTYGLKFFMEVLSSSDISSILQSQVVLDIKFISNFLYLPLLFKNSLLLYRFWPSAVVNLTVALVLCLLVYIFAKKSYLNLLLKNIESGGSKRTEQTLRKSLLDQFKLVDVCCPSVRISHFYFIISLFQFNGEGYGSCFPALL